MPRSSFPAASATMRYAALGGVLLVLGALTGPRLAGQTKYPAGEPLIASNPLTAWRLNGPNSQATLVNVAAPGFTQAWQIATKADTSPAYAIEWRTPVTRAVAKGDVAFLRFMARAVETSDESGGAYLRVVAQKASADWDKSLQMTFTVTSSWQEFLIPFAFIADYGASAAEITFGFGFKRQTVELGGFDFVYYGKGVALADLPRTRISYTGSEPGAAWRTAALARIESLRKSDFSISVVDAAGALVPGATVSVRQTKSAFQFGSALQFARLANDSKDNLAYRQKVLELFNAASDENDLKWPQWEATGSTSYSIPQTLRALAWLKNHGLHIRGHNLVWPSWKNLPSSITSLRGTPRESEIPALTLAHIQDIVSRTREFTEEWDVINEPYTNHDLMDLFGQSIVVDWFKAARDAHPSALLFLNDYSNHDAALDPAHVAAFEGTARYLKQQGAPIGGIGIQAHISGTPSAPANVIAVLDRYAALGLAVRFTEFDVNTDDEQLQADYTRDFLIAAYSHPTVIGFQMWGFWEGAHWIPKAAMYRTDWSEKPNARAYKALVLDEWRTRANGTTDARGQWRGRGFHGDYVVTVEHGGRQFEQTFSLQPGSSPTIRVPLVASQLMNVSTRAAAGTADATLIPGFIIEGAGPKRVLVRGIGPGLAAFGVTGTVGRMELSVRRADGTVVAANRGWDTGSANATTALIEASITAGAFPLARGSDDCALLLSLPPGAYTAPIAPLDGRSGVALVEAYDVDVVPTARLRNLSARTRVGTGQDVAIPGIVISGANARTLLVRAVGPGLVEFGVGGVLAQPSLVVARGDTPLAANSGWEISADPASITAAEGRVGAFPLKPGRSDAALVFTAPAGAYTIQVSGADGGSGIVLVEVYDVSS